MDNISKALLIAGGVFLSIMIITLLVILRNQMSGYFTEEHNAKIIEQTLEFNNKFENYNGQTIRGNELISIMNRVSDYNNTAADMEGYDRVIIEIGYIDENVQNKFKNNEENDRSIFEGVVDSRNILTNKSSDEDLNKIVNFTSLLKQEYSHIPNLTDTNFQKLSSEISNIIGDSKQENDEDFKEKRVKKIKRILGIDIDENPFYLPFIQDIAMRYHQYTWFKRAKFVCTDLEHDGQSGVKYNTQNGRVNKITFKIKVEGDNVIFD